MTYTSYSLTMFGWSSCDIISNKINSLYFFYHGIDLAFELQSQNEQFQKLAVTEGQKDRTSEERKVTGFPINDAWLLKYEMSIFSIILFSLSSPSRSGYIFQYWETSAYFGKPCRLFGGSESKQVHRGAIGLTDKVTCRGCFAPV